MPGEHHRFHRRAHDRSWTLFSSDCFGALLPAVPQNAAVDGPPPGGVRAKAHVVAPTVRLPFARRGGGGTPAATPHRPAGNHAASYTTGPHVFQ